MRPVLWIVPALCAGCAGSQISDEVLRIARATMPAGEFHMEFGADGDLIEAGGAVALDMVPADCRAAADEAHPGGRQTGAERAYVDGSPCWMVAKDLDGRALEILVRENGTVCGGEEVLPTSAWPPAVVAAARAAVPDAALERVERVWGSEARGDEAYHLKFDQRGESVRVGVSSDGKVLRIVRRLEGQLRIPR